MQTNLLLFGCFQKVFIAYSLDCPICEHAEQCNILASTSRNKKFALRAASSLESTTREQRALLIFSACSNPYGNPFLWNNTENILKRGFNLERTKFSEASLSDTLSRSNQLQSNDVTFPLYFIMHVFLRIRMQRSREELTCDQAIFFFLYFFSPPKKKKNRLIAG